MSLTNIKGDVGSGKTLLMAIIAYYSKKPNYANFELFMENYNHLTPDMLMSLNDGSKVFIDEAYAWIDCRKSAGSDINIYLSQIVFQSRKKGMDMYLSDQLIETIDLRFRLLPQTVIECIKIRDGFKYIIDHYPRYKKPYILRMSEKAAEKFYSMYDTYEIVKPLNQDIMFDMGMSKEEKYNTVDAYVDEICRELPPKKITLPICNNYFDRKNLPKGLIKDIFGAIKTRAVRESSNGLDETIMHEITETVKSRTKTKPLSKKKKAGA
jgi:hypothetical protein